MTLQTNTPEYSEFIALSRYARWLPDENRRESWEETVNRYINFMYNHLKENTNIDKSQLEELYNILGADCER